MCITSVTISHKAISSGVECASSSHKQEKYSSGPRAAASEPWETTPAPAADRTASAVSAVCGVAPAWQPLQSLKRVMICLEREEPWSERGFQYQSKAVLWLSLVSVSSWQRFRTCQTFPLASAAICATGAPADVWTSQCTKHSSSLVLISLTPAPASHFSPFVSQWKCILHRLLQSGFYRDHLLILFLHSANITFPSFSPFPHRTSRNQCV